jgi:hypothetical protein
MWSFFRRNSFKEVASLNCAIVRFNGYFHFTLDKSKARRGWDEYMRFGLYLLLGLYMSLKSSNINIGTRNSLIFEMGMTVLLQLSVFAPTVFRIFNFVVRHKHVRIVENIDWIDKRLSEMGIEINHSKHFRAALVITISYFCSLYFALFLDEILTMKYLPEIEVDMVEGIFAVINVAAYLTYQITHMLLVVAMHFRVQYLNRVLESGEPDITSIRMMRKIHLRILDTMAHINACYSLNLLNFFFQFTFFNVFFYFGLIHHVIADNSTFKEIVVSIIIFGYVQFFFWFCAWMILHSSLLKNGGESLDDTVRAQVMFAKNRKLLRHFNIFNFQLQHQKIEVSAGLFVIDWSFLFGIISVLFSYLIILIQFDTA